MNILIVEDDERLASSIVSWIEQWGYRAETSATGEEALEKVRQNNIDLALLDIYLPDTDARDLIPKLKKLKPEFKIITMTGHNTEELEREIRKLGIVYYMSKPFPLQELKTILDHISKKNERR